MTQNYPSKQDLHSMPNSILIESTELLVRKERQLIEVLIWHLQEIQDRKLYISMGYSSLYECLVKHFKYSESVAYQRLSALKIIKAVPLASQSLKEGKVSLTTLCQVQSVIQKQEKDLGAKLSIETKQSYLKSIENKTSQQVKHVLAEINPTSALPKDKVIYLTKEYIQLQITVDRELLEKINNFKSLISHENINPSYNEILNTALDHLIEVTKKKKGILSPQNRDLIEKKSNTRSKEKKGNVHSKEKNGNTYSNQIPLDKKLNKQKIKQGLLVRNFKTNPKSLNPDLLRREKGYSRYISRKIKQQIFKRSDGTCEHISSKGERCRSKFQLQFDHIEPVSLGGNSELINLQHLCRSHNLFKILFVNWGKEYFKQDTS